VKGHVSRDHVHLLVSVPPYIAMSKLVQRIKGVTSRKLLQENKGLNKAFWGRHLWSRGYFVASTGNVSEEVIASYPSRPSAATKVVEKEGRCEFSTSRFLRVFGAPPANSVWKTPGRSMGLPQK